MNQSPYFIDIAQISLPRYQKILETTELMPGRRMLYEQLGKRFDLLGQAGINDLAMLVEATKTKAKIQRLALETDIPEDYLIILRREVGRFLPKPVSLIEFPGVDSAMVSKLRMADITTSLQLFEHGDTPAKRKSLAQGLEVPVSEVEVLTKLADISRIYGVGPVFCRVFLETGIDTVEKVAMAEPEDLFDRLNAVIQSQQYTKVKCSLRDISACIAYAQDLPSTIIFR